jgi:hypothetical protein
MEAIAQAAILPGSWRLAPSSRGGATSARDVGASSRAVALGIVKPFAQTRKPLPYFADYKAHPFVRAL